MRFARAVLCFIDSTTFVASVCEGVHSLLVFIVSCRANIISKMGEVQCFAGMIHAAEALVTL